MSIGINETHVATMPGAGHTLLLIGDNEIVGRYPVLGFMVFEEIIHDLTGNKHKNQKAHYVYPVIAAGLWDDNSQEYVLLRPDGIVEKPFWDEWDNLQDFEAYLASRAKKLASSGMV